MIGYDAATLFQFLVHGIAVGLVYALVALGFTAIFNSCGVVNFAQGTYVMLGGMVTYALFKLVGWPLGLAALGAIIVTAGAGALSYYGVAAPLFRQSARPYTVMIALFGVHMIFENVALRTIGSTGVGFPSFTSGEPLVVLGATISRDTLWIAGGAILLMCLLNVLFRQTMLGRAWRAAAAEPMAARLMGISVPRMVLISFLVSAVLGAVGGILITPSQFTAFNVGLAYGLKGFAAALVGGVGNIYGAVLGGLLIGVVESLSVAFIPASAKDAVTFTVLYLVVVARPSGLLPSLVEFEE